MGKRSLVTSVTKKEMLEIQGIIDEELETNLLDGVVTLELDHYREEVVYKIVVNKTLENTPTIKLVGRDKDEVLRAFLGFMDGYYMNNADDVERIHRGEFK